MNDEKTGVLVILILLAVGCGLYFSAGQESKCSGGFVKIPKEMFADIFSRGALDRVSEITPEMLKPKKKGK